METYRIPKPGECYRHFKGNRYQVLAIAMHTETEEQLVVYEGLYGEHPVFARPLSMFCGKVDKQKFPDSCQEYRFELDEETAVASNDVQRKILHFLELDSYKEKSNYLKLQEAYVTDEFLSAVAVSLDFTESADDLKSRYYDLMKYIEVLQKYERKAF